MDNNFQKLEEKWQKKWEDNRINYFNKDKMDKKLYCMEMFSYPSGANLHLGHWFNFGLSDSWVRFKKMQGFEVFHPMGFDAFGLPAENYAIKTKTHPSIKTYESINTMRRQLRQMGGMYDWDHEIVTCDENYYKWTQWIFLQLFKHSLAYKKEASVNWCGSCKTVLANEQAAGGVCERCGTQVVQKKMNQWFLKITDYAQELLDGLDDLDWPDITKRQQRNWIGRSEGAIISFKIDNMDESFEIYTTRPDTIYGVTYVVLAPEHDLVEKIVTDEYKQIVEDYCEKSRLATELERQSTDREKTGVFTGRYAINPINNKKVPIFISDYVLSSYGTGAIMAVPAHDQRDFDFAKKFGLDIIQVIEGNCEIADHAYEGDGTLINSDVLNGLSKAEGIKKAIEKMEEMKIGYKKVNYRLRDWLISRQRYWGAPIPIIYCDECGIVPVEEKDLPVRLPRNVEFQPNGQSPLIQSEEFCNTVCPKCGRPAKRETDTMDTFMCSSWYQLRYPDSKNSKEAFNKELLNSMLPVDKYVGGKEHICLHLIYSRFITKALRDMGYLNVDEPFKSLVHQGTILGPDGSKMSKSKGNTISPDEYIEKYGSDTFRAYLMFGFNYVDGGPWSDEGMRGMAKFINKFITIVEKAAEVKDFKNIKEKEETELLYRLNYTIKAVTEGFEKFQFNTSMARIMELTEAIRIYMLTNRNSIYLKESIESLIKLLAPAAPHICEELWGELGHENSIFISGWPEIDEDALNRETIELPVQINGKVKKVISVSVNDSKEDIIKIATEEMKTLFEGYEVKKTIYVPNKILNFIVSKA